MADTRALQEDKIVYLEKTFREEEERELEWYERSFRRHEAGLSGFKREALREYAELRKTKEEPFHGGFVNLRLKPHEKEEIKEYIRGRSKWDLPNRKALKEEIDDNQKRIPEKYKRLPFCEDENGRVVTVLRGRECFFDGCCLPCFLKGKQHRVAGDMFIKTDRAWSLECVCDIFHDYWYDNTTLTEEYHLAGKTPAVVAEAFAVMRLMRKRLSPKELPELFPEQAAVMENYFQKIRR